MPNPSSDGAPDLKYSKRRMEPPSRLPPFNAEAESAILGCCLIDNSCIGRFVEAFKGSSEAFYDLRNTTIIETMISIFDDREPVDEITLSDRLKAFDQLEKVGGLAYIAALQDAVPSAANLDYYIGIVRDCWLRRKMIQTATNVVSSMFDPPKGDLEEALDECERSILQVSESRVTQQQETIRVIVREAMREIEQTLDSRGEPSGLSTGFKDFDKLTDGMHAGEMIIVAARPSQGKTALCLNIADSLAVAQRIPVGIFSLEMTKTQLVKRMIASRARVNLRTLTQGFVADRDAPKLTSAAGQISASPLYIDDEGGISILQLRAKARRMWQQYGIKLFVIDYLQLVHGLKAESRQQEVAQVSTGIKNLAKELSVPIIVAAQLNREIEREKNRRPRLADLRESGQQEADADVVTFLYRQGDGDDESENRDAVPVNWLIGKSRNGPAGEDIYLTFLKSFTRFEPRARISDEDVPAESSQMEM